MCALSGGLGWGAGGRRLASAAQVVSMVIAAEGARLLRCNDKHESWGGNNEKKAAPVRCTRASSLFGWPCEQNDLTANEITSRTTSSNRTGRQNHASPPHAHGHALASAVSGRPASGYILITVLNTVLSRIRFSSIRRGTPLAVHQTRRVHSHHSETILAVCTLQTPRPPRAGAAPHHQHTTDL